MTSKEFKKVGRLLKELYKELEQEALSEGLDIFGEQYAQMQSTIRRALLTKMGFTNEEYVEARDRVVNEQKRQREELERLKNEVIGVEEKAEDKLSADDVLDLIEKNQKPPQITEKTVNKIVKEKTVEKPTVVKETKTIVEREEYEDGPLWAELGFLHDKIESLDIPEEVDKEELYKEVRNIFGEMFEHNIDTLGMPNFRKLAMGLQDQVDKVAAGVSNTVSVSGNYTVLPGDYTVVVEAAGDISLPSAPIGKEFNIKNLTSQNITVTAPTNIDNEASQTVTPFGNMHLQFTGTQYIII